LPLGRETIRARFLTLFALIAAPNYPKDPKASNVSGRSRQSSSLTGKSCKLATGLVVIAAFLTSRMIYLDQDMPVWTFVFYAPTDEPYYTIPAFNLYYFGTWTKRVFDFLPADENPFLAIQNLLTYAGLLAFGNNYFGVRVASVACGAVVFICTAWSVSNVHTHNRSWRAFVVACTAVYMFVDFFFLQSNRINDPTSFMMAATSLCMVMVILLDRHASRSLVTSLIFGMIAGLIVTFVYVYMIYVAAALGTTIAIRRALDDPRRLVWHLLAFSIGAVLAILLFAAFVWICFHSSPIEELKNLMTVGGSRLNFMDVGILSFIARNMGAGLKQNLVHNLFFYNPTLLFLYLAALPVFGLNLIRNRAAIDIFVAGCIVFRLALSVLVPFDYYEKKLIQVYPLVLYVIGSAAIGARSTLEQTPGNRRGYLAVYLIALPGFAFLVNGLTQTRLPEVYAHHDLIAHKAFYAALITLPLLLVRRELVRIAAALMLLVFAVVPNIRLAHQFVYGSPSFMYRDSMIEAAPKLNGKILAGGVAYVMRFYNTSLPIMNFYMYYSYGYDKFASYAQCLYRSKLVDGTILFIPFHAAPILRPTYDYVESGGLALDQTFDLNDVQRMYKFGLYIVPGGRVQESEVKCPAECGVGCP